MRITRRFWMAGAGAAFGLLAEESEKQGMIVRSTRPVDLEMPNSGFMDYLTPVERFFVRSHHYAPEVELGTWKLETGGLVEKPITLTYEQLRRMPRVELVAVLECAGNGRGLQDPPVPGLQWRTGAVGNARWAGVRLADVLRLSGVKAGARHVLCDGADEPIGTMPKFQRTIPMSKAMHPDTMLAYEMNGKPLAGLHGFPLRLIAPGWGSDSWTKWIRRITVLDKDFEGFFMAVAYRHPGAPVPPGSSVDPKMMKPVEALRVKSVIGSPLEGATVAAGSVKVSGAAWTGESQVTNVEVSTDSGRTWKSAAFGPETSKYGWRLWSYQAQMKPGYYNVMARARDARGDVQPLVQEWNPSGYLWNVVPRIGLVVGTEASPARSEAAATMPEASAQLKRACLVCHDMDVMAQQRLTQAQWERELDKMTRWGAQMNPESRRSILDFLVNRFGYVPKH